MTFEKIKINKITQNINSLANYKGFSYFNLILTFCLNFQFTYFLAYCYLFYCIKLQ